MHEVRFHGRGGQGAVMASKILAKAFIEEGKHAVAIPSFGFERRGAPVAAFLRYSDNVIRSMTNIYRPDVILCIDPTVWRAVDIFAGMKPGGTLILATKGDGHDGPKAPEDLGKIATCNAFAIAMEIFKRPITNSIMLGAFAKATDAVSLDSLKAGLETANFRDAGLEQNMEAIDRGYHETRITTASGEVAA